MGADRVIIFDTTLRDGEQALKASLSRVSKLKIAKCLERLGVDYIEAGFPVSSPGDFQSVQQIAREIQGARVCGLARAIEKDIDACAQSLNVAEQFRIHTFIATSPLHREVKLRMNLDQALDAAYHAVSYARNFTDDVEFSCEDAGRTPLPELCRFVDVAIKAGAKTINIPDTVGYTMPWEFSHIISYILDNVADAEGVTLSVHCHDDLGLSVANSILAVRAGARQVEGTVNGIGERAGNCALEEIALILDTRRDELGLSCGLKLREIHTTSKVVSSLCNMVIQPNKAIVGENAFSHSSGIHQDGVLKGKETYEIITPESIGVPTNQLNLTSRSGRHVIKHRLSSMGYSAGVDYDLDLVYEKFLTLADRKGTVYNYDLEAILWLEDSSRKSYILEYLCVNAGSATLATATIKLNVNGKTVSEAAVGNGPVDAVYNAIDAVTSIKLDIKNYSINAAGGGRDALGKVNITAEVEGRAYHGIGASTDIVEASAEAYLSVLNTFSSALLVGECAAKVRQGANRSCDRASLQSSSGV